MFFDTQKYICNSCKTVFERTFFETLHCKLQKCPKCGSYNIRNLSIFDNVPQKPEQKQKPDDE